MSLGKSFHRQKTPRAIFMWRNCFPFLLLVWQWKIITSLGQRYDSEYVLYIGLRHDMARNLITNKTDVINPPEELCPWSPTLDGWSSNDWAGRRRSGRRWLMDLQKILCHLTMYQSFLGEGRLELSSSCHRQRHVESEAPALKKQAAERFQLGQTYLFSSDLSVRLKRKRKRSWNKIRRRFITENAYSRRKAR